MKTGRTKKLKPIETKVKNLILDKKVEWELLHTDTTEIEGKIDTEL